MLISPKAWTTRSFAPTASMPPLSPVFPAFAINPPLCNVRVCADDPAADIVMPPPPSRLREFTESVKAVLKLELLVRTELAFGINP